MVDRASWFYYGWQDSKGAKIAVRPSSRSTMYRPGRMHDLCALLNPILVDSANPNQAIGYLAAETSALSLRFRRCDFSTFDMRLLFRLPFSVPPPLFSSRSHGSARRGKMSGRGQRPLSVSLCFSFFFSFVFERE